MTFHLMVHLKIYFRKVMVLSIKNLKIYRRNTKKAQKRKKIQTIKEKKMVLLNLNLIPTMK